MNTVSQNRPFTASRILLLLLALVLIAYSSYRAYTISFTHDEALTYTIVKGEGWSVAQTANNHPLNTKLMIVCAKIFGTSEFSLRLPNVLAHLLYLGFGFLLLRRIGNSYMRFSAFAFLNFNPFLLDFFGLARGYGLALGFLLAAIYFLLRAWEERNAFSFRTIAFLAASMLAALFSDWSNYTMLNVHFGLFWAVLARFFFDGSKFEFSRKALYAGLVLLLLQSLCWFPLFRELIHLKNAGELYYGGKNGFVPDTIYSLLNSSAYMDTGFSGFPNLIISLVIILFFLCGAFFSIRHLRKKNKAALPELSGFILVFLWLVTELEFLFTDSLFPRDRTALFFIPLYAIFIFSVFDREKSVRWTQVFFSAGALYFIFQSALCFNFSHSLSWYYDQKTKTVMTDFAADIQSDKTGKMYRGGNSWQLEPVLNYYRDRFGLQERLEPFVRDRIADTSNDMIYVLSSDDTLVDRSVYKVKNVFRFTGTVEYRRQKP